VHSNKLPFSQGIHEFIIFLEFLKILCWSTTIVVVSMQVCVFLCVLVFIKNSFTSFVEDKKKGWLQYINIIIIVQSSCKSQ
jgi:hypothetical protein